MNAEPIAAATAALVLRFRRKANPPAVPSKAAGTMKSAIKIAHSAPLIRVRLPREAGIDRPESCQIEDEAGKPTNAAANASTASRRASK